MTLSETERDYIAYLALLRGVPEAAATESWLAARRRFGFGQPRYKKFCREIHELFSVAYGNETEADLIRSYQFHSVLHTFRMVALAERRDAWAERQANALLKEVRTNALVVVDYGAGLGHLSFAIRQRCPWAIIHLVDIPGHMLDFTIFRFGRHGLIPSVLFVTEQNPYPALPIHDICIASESMEHLQDPMRAYENIRAAMVPGGLLFGSFRDHARTMFHVSPDLSALREAIAGDYDATDLPGLYRRRGAECQST